MAQRTREAPLDLARSQRCEWILENLDLVAATGEDDAVYEDVQIALWNDTSIMSAYNKGRQEGMSFAAAADAVAACWLSPGTICEFVSFNLDESKTKIRYAKDIIDALWPRVRPRLVTNNVSELELDVGGKKTSWIYSLPSKPTRGRKSRKYFDEIAHVLNDTAIFRAGRGGLARGGVIRAMTTPLGQRGEFHKIMTRRDEFPSWVVSTWPWWSCYGMCTDVARAMEEAPLMETEERVRAFGSERLKIIYEGFGLDLEGFQQEHECAFVDEAGSFFPYDLQKTCEADIELVAVNADGTYNLAPVITSEPVFLGFDVGRHKHRSAIVGLQRQDGVLRVVLLDTMHRVPFPKQLARMRGHIEALNALRTCVDKGGMGEPVYDDLSEAFGTARVEGLNFTQALKETLMTVLKSLYEKQEILVPVNRVLRHHLHSIRQIQTVGGNFRYDSDADDTGHADLAWALAMAVMAAGTAGAPALMPMAGGSRRGWDDGYGDRSGF